MQNHLCHLHGPECFGSFSISFRVEGFVYTCVYIYIYTCIYTHNLKPKPDLSPLIMVYSQERLRAEVVSAAVSISRDSEAGRFLGIRDLEGLHRGTGFGAVSVLRVLV